MTGHKAAGFTERDSNPTFAGDISSGRYSIQKKKAMLTSGRPQKVDRFPIKLSHPLERARLWLEKTYASI
jgi:hypothetical protein